MNADLCSSAFIRGNIIAYMKDTDLELVSACRSGDPLAWEKLIRRYQRLIYAIPLRAGLNEDEAADIFQDVFTTLFQKLNDRRARIRVGIHE